MRFEYPADPSDEAGTTATEQAGEFDECGNRFGVAAEVTGDDERVRCGGKCLCYFDGDLRGERGRLDGGSWIQWMNSLRPPGSSPRIVDGDAPAKTRTGRGRASHC
jgi:hypothetical protein